MTAETESQAPGFTHLELHRSGIGLAPTGPGQEGAAVYVEAPGVKSPLRSCPCNEGRGSCVHVKALSRAVKEVQGRFAHRGWNQLFEATPWARLAALLSRDAPHRCADLRVRPLGDGEDAGATGVVIVSAGDEELGRWLEPGPGQTRLLERLGVAGAADRAGVLHRLAMFQWTKQERLLADAGMKSRRQTMEEGFWHRFGYHCVRELGADGTRFQPAVDRTSGRFALICRRAEGGDPVAELALPRDSVREALELLAEAFPGQEDLKVRPIPLRTIFHVNESVEIEEANGDREVEIRPVIQALQARGEEVVLEQAEVEKFRYGRLVYLKELDVLAELERPGRERKFKAPRRLRLDWSRVASFVDEHREEMAEGLVDFDGLMAERRIFREVDGLSAGEADLEDAEGRSWYWLSLAYGFGSSEVSLARLLEARREGAPYVETADGWVDLEAPAFRHLDSMLAAREGDMAPAEREGRMPVTAQELLRLQAETGRAVAVDGSAAGDEKAASALRGLLELRPAAPYRQPAALETPLRTYQALGTEWLRFLWENRLGGILADDMGLGKTHQAMALFAQLRDAGVERPSLVVCPTSVLSHWRAKIRDHAPGLRVAIHHGLDRDLAAALAEGDVVVTSYGVLRRDAEELAAIEWAVAAFDEIQHLKNPETKGWKAAATLGANLRVGLTGTPIENSVRELKALFDLVLPGYLGTDRAFEARYVEPDAREEDRLDELHRLTSPFVLRRTKETVLDELPEKIEDLRTAPLSDEQVALYREAVADRGRRLSETLRTGEGEIPYLHVFAVLNLLKQICDHPALALGTPERAPEHASGKWDLYSELLDECLDAGQKVVVFSQYLGMIEIIRRDLEARGVEHAILTGSSRNRGDLVERFNTDENCRVFVGSLKAGGTGIDLVGGSVVVHYDRWWNAAREDQATDRVHRMGQRRVVQVFKLVTEGTLEEKIHAVIERKRRLMSSVVREDDHRLSKVFTREELLEMLRPV